MKGELIMETIVEKLTPKDTVRAICTDCLSLGRWNNEKVKDCEGDSVGCVIFPHRLGKRISVKTLRKYCIISCMNGYRDLVDTCVVESCPNFPYRFGKNPALSGKVNLKGIEALKKYRENMVGK
jgi:hypothetical protein